MKIKALLLLIPLVCLVTGCSQQLSLQGSEAGLAGRTATESASAVIFPDDDPIIPDGKKVWSRLHCAECHSDTGAPVAGKCQVDLSDTRYMAKQKPLDQYVFLTYGKEGVNHPKLKDSASRREIWDLVFYTRSLAIPPLAQAEVDQIDAVFGSNCAVCHGKRGHGDGPLAHNMEPVPANFHQYSRFYDRTDDLLYDHIANGINWAGMPNFLNKKDSAKNVTFDQAYIRKPVAYVRHFHSQALAPGQETTAPAPAKTQ